MSTALSVRERFHAVCDGRPVDRLPLIEWVNWWPETVHRWAAEGLGFGGDYAYERETVVRLQRTLGLDPWAWSYLSPASRETPAPATHGGGILAHAEDYPRLRSTFLRAAPPDAGFEPGLRSDHDGGRAVLGINLEGFFWWPRRLLGIEGHLLAFVDRPELLHAICEDHVAWMERAVLALEVKPDLVMIGEDLSYNHGPMISQRTFQTFLAPYYRRIIPILKERGMRVFIDSDGDVTSCLPWFASVGCDGVLPLERQAGVDIAQLQASHPAIIAIGHFDKMTLSRGARAMRDEFERLLPAMRRGRFIPSIDHQTPPSVSLAAYRTYVDLLRWYAQAAAVNPGPAISANAAPR